MSMTVQQQIAQTISLLVGLLDTWTDRPGYPHDGLDTKLVLVLYDDGSGSIGTTRATVGMREHLSFNSAEECAELMLSPQGEE